MTLFCFLFVCLLLVGLAACPEVRVAVSDLWLHWFGVRQRVWRGYRDPFPQPRSKAVDPLKKCSPLHDRLPPPRVITRAGPQ